MAISSFSPDDLTPIRQKIQDGRGGINGNEDAELTAAHQSYEKGRCIRPVEERAVDGSQRVALIAVSDRQLALDSGHGLGRLGYKVVMTAGGEAAAAGLRDAGLDTHFRPLDPTDQQEVAVLVESLGSSPGRIDVLITDGAAEESGASRSAALFPAVLPLMRAQGYGRIVLLTNDAPASGPVADTQDTNIKINRVCPVHKRVEIALRLATLPDDGPSGGTFRD